MPRSRWSRFHAEKATGAHSTRQPILERTVADINAESKNARRVDWLWTILGLIQYLSTWITCFTVHVLPVYHTYMAPVGILLTWHKIAQAFHSEMLLQLRRMHIYCPRYSFVQAWKCSHIAQATICVSARMPAYCPRVDFCKRDSICICAGIILFLSLQVCL